MNVLKAEQLFMTIAKLVYLAIVNINGAVLPFDLMVNERASCVLGDPTTCRGGILGAYLLVETQMGGRNGTKRPACGDTLGDERLGLRFHEY